MDREVQEAGEPVLLRFVMPWGEGRFDGYGFTGREEVEVVCFMFTVGRSERRSDDEVLRKGGGLNTGRAVRVSVMSMRLDEREDEDG